jgi:hypothetical protein
MPQTYAPIRAGAGGILLEAPDTLPSVGVLALAVDAAGKMSSVAFPETTRETLGLATTDSPTFAGMTFSGQALTGSQATSLLDLATTWNTTGTPSAFKLNVTDTASNAASLLMDLQVGGVSEFKVDKKGAITTRQNRINTHTIGNLSIISGNSNDCTLRALGNAGIFIQFSALSTALLQIGGRFQNDGADLISQRNGTNGQKSRLYKTYTSATSGEWLELDAATDASNFDIAASIGSAGGTARGIRIGGKNAAGTFTPWVSFATTGYAQVASRLSIGGATAGNALDIYSGGAASIGVLPATNAAGYFSFAYSGKVAYFGVENSTGGFLFAGSSAFGAVMGTKQAHPVEFFTNNIKRLSIDSSGVIIASGAVQLGNAAVAETPAATHTLIIKDSTGTSYRVLAVAV